jgi:hypothetical protein
MALCTTRSDYFWDALEMSRKVVMTGMLMFVSKGSLVQVVVGIVISIVFLMMVAYLQPYASPAANLFKLGAEAALVLTLIIVVLLKIDLSREGFEDPDWWAATLGSILVMANTMLPSAGLCAGLLVFGFDQIVVAVDHVIPDDEDDRPKKTKKKNDNANAAKTEATFANPIDASVDNESVN